MNKHEQAERAFLVLNWLWEQVHEGPPDDSVWGGLGGVPLIAAPPLGPPALMRRTVMRLKREGLVTGFADSSGHCRSRGGGASVSYFYRLTEDGINVYRGACLVRAHHSEDS